MASATGEEKKARRKVADWRLLLGVIAAGGVAFWFADDYGIDRAWIYGAGAAAIFFVAVGRRYRSLFRSPEFVIFFTIWALIHVIVFLLVLAYLGFLYYIPIMLLELWVGYMIAIRRFGPPQDRL
jgi:hypothetical protein